MSSQEIYIEKCSLDEKFTVVPNELVRDETISPNCRWLIIYLLSNCEEWKIRVDQVVNHCKGFLGRQSVEELFREARKAGYMLLEDYYVNGLKRIKYKLSWKPKFKKCLPDTNLRGPAVRGPAERCPKEEKDSYSSISSLDEEKKIHIKRRSVAPPSAEASGLCDFFLESVKKRFPKNDSKVIPSWLKDMDSLLKRRTSQEIKDIITWSESANHYSYSVLSPKSLGKRFNEMEAKMIGREREKGMDVNRQWALGVKAKYPDKLKHMVFNDRFIRNVESGETVNFDLPIDTFKRVFVSIFGGSI